MIMTISLTFCEIPEKIREICAEKWRKGVKIRKNKKLQKLAKICKKPAKIDDILTDNFENWCEGLQNSSDSPLYLCR